MDRQLNSPQTEAVQTVCGRVLILAGAGSGKTSVLAHRIAHLIQHHQIPPESILGLTFTNKAAEEMRKRVTTLIGAQGKGIVLCTFHSFCMRVLREEIHHLGYTSDFTIYDERDVKRIITQAAREVLEHEGELPSIESIMSKISWARSKGESISKDDALAGTLFEKLQVCMRAYNAVDFDSLLTLTVELFQKHPDVLRKYQTQFRYIMIDEYQDTNQIQYQLAELLSQEHNNLCVVGDDDQSIYGWRGAEIKNILSFASAKTIKLEQNYRSTPTILAAANGVIKHNKERHNKTLWSAKDKGPPILLFHAPTEKDEAQSIAERLVWYRKKHNISWSEMAVLYRSNILSRALEIALMQAAWETDKGEWRRGIPYEVFGGTELLERSEVKDLAAYLRAIVNRQDEEALLRIINVPRRGVSDHALDLITQANRSQQVPLWEMLQRANELHELSEKAKNGIEQFVELLTTAEKKVSEGSLHKAVDWLLTTIDYQKAIDEDVKSDKMRAFKWDNVMSCVEAIAAYEEQKAAETAPASLSDFLSEFFLVGNEIVERKGKQREDRVSLMTFHGAKGLEFTACFLAGLEDHLIPHEKSVAERGLEEERRLLYVAMTRAKKFLTMSMARERNRMGRLESSQPSRFIFEIPQEHFKAISWQDFE